MSNKTEKTELEILSYIVELLALGYINTAKIEAIKWYELQEDWDKLYERG